MMNDFINNLFKNTLYIKIKSSQISVYHVEKDRTVEDIPLVALSLGRKDKRILVAFGSEARSAVSKNNGSVTLHNGFDHPRSCINDFEIAAITLRVLINRSVSKLMMILPTIILHPLDKVEGGLTQVEHKALLELGATVGRKVYVWSGRVLECQELLSLNFPKSGGKLGWGDW